MASPDWNELRAQFAKSLKQTIGELTDDSIEALDGPIRDASNRLTVAVRNRDEKLMKEVRGEITLRMQALGLKAKASTGGTLDMVMGVAINFLFNGAVAALGAVKI